jgi:hypothetical protein
MKDLIQEIRKSRLEPEMILVIDKLNGYKKVTYIDSPDSVFYEVNNEIIIETQDKYLFVDYNRFIKPFRETFPHRLPKGNLYLVDLKITELLKDFLKFEGNFYLKSYNQDIRTSRWKK